MFMYMKFIKADNFANFWAKYRFIYIIEKKSLGVVNAKENSVYVFIITIFIFMYFDKTPPCEAR